MLKRLSVIIAVLVAVAASVSLRAEILEQVLVKVNGDFVTKTEFELRQVQELRTRPALANVSSTSPELQKAIAEVTPDLILDLVDNLLMVQRGRELGYAMGDEQFAGVMENIKKENRIETDEQFQQALRESGMTLADLRQEVERSMIVQRVRQVDVMEKISVTEEESRVYYEAHRNEFTTPAEIMLRELFIEVPEDSRGVNVAADDAAREQAQDIRRRLLAGEPFPQLAAEFSAAPSKANGGLVGPVKEQDLAPSLQKQINAMKVGDVGEVTRVTRGYQILKLESRSETKIRSFEDARDDISRRVADQKARGELLKYLDRLRAQATIVWKNDELKKAYELALEKRAQALAAQPAA